MRLYTYWRSSASWRVRIALAYKGLDHAPVPVHLVRDGGEQHQAAHRARSPLGQVPVLEVDDPEATGGTLRLTQSLAIIEYLEERHPTPALLPATAPARAQARQLAEVVNAGIQPLQNLAVLQRLAALGVDRKAWGAEVIGRGLAALEQLAQASAGQFLVGDAVTIADLCLIPQLYSARRFDVDLEGLSTLRRVEARCEALDAFIAAHPDRQPDAEPQR